MSRPAPLVQRVLSALADGGVHSGQQLAARHFYRPRAADVLATLGPRFPNLTLVPITDPMFGGWDAAQKKHFDEGGVFDQIVVAR